MKDQNDGRHRAPPAANHSGAAQRTTTYTARRPKKGGPGITLTITNTGPHPGEDPFQSPGVAVFKQIAWKGLPGFKYPTIETAILEQPLSTKDVVIGERIGWRAWRYDPVTKDLRSMVFSHPWVPGEPMHGPHSGELFGSGVHANKTLRQLKANYKHCFSWFAAFDFFSGDIVYGQVALWGDVIEHERGYRAEYGKPLSLYWASRPAYFSREKRAILKELRKQYLSDT